MLTVCGKDCATGDVVTVTIEAGRISRIQAGDTPDAPAAPGVWLSAGFFDLQLNGYGGYDFNRGVWGAEGEISNALEPLFDKVARSGTALFCPTFTTNSREALCAGLKALADFLDRDTRRAKAVPGIHLEGPYLSGEDGPRGAHPREYVRDPNWDEFQRFQEAAQGRIKLCTLAPERPGALDFIAKLTAADVTVALGHTAASPDIICEAVYAGARLSTHLGNGAHSQITRHPNYIWEQLAHDALYASVIADGHHLPDAVLKVFARAKGADKLALISDAVALGGLPPARYMRDRYEVLPTGRIVLAGTPYLAGAGHLLDTCVAHAGRVTDLTLAQVTRCVSVIPARILGLEARKGRLQAGYDADLTLFRVPAEGPLEIMATICGGEVVYSAS